MLLITTQLYFQSERRRLLAEKRFTEARSMAHFIIGEIDPQLARLPGALPLRRQLVQRSARYLQTLESDRTAPASLQLDIAAGYLSAARIYGYDPSGGIGNFSAAQESLDHAKSLLRALPRATRTILRFCSSKHALI